MFIFCCYASNPQPLLPLEAFKSCEYLPYSPHPYCQFSNWSRRRKRVRSLEFLGMRSWDLSREGALIIYRHLMPIWFLIRTRIPVVPLPLDVWCIVCVWTWVPIYYIYLDLVYGHRNIFLFHLTCAMLNYGLVCSWRSYSIVNVGQFLHPDHTSHPCSYNSSENA